jgi:hypothetical protein
MNAILLAGAALVGLPILLHLIMKQEPKRLVFPALRFLQVRQKTNQRKMRLRHFLLLFLRMLLIALFCLTLYQPRMKVERLGLGTERPIAAVVILDTSPSMGYTVNGASRLAEARRLAHEWLDKLPANSKVAVLEPNDPFGNWEQSLADAHTRLDTFKEPAGFAPPLTETLASAYQLLKSIDAETGSEQPWPRMVALFGDRMASSWDGRRNDSLVKLRDSIPDPKPVHLFVDVGVDKPTNVAILGVEMRPQLVSGAADPAFTVTVRADGADVPSAAITVNLDDNAAPERRELNLVAGSQQAVSFKFAGLAPGFHTAVIRLRDDNLGFDNIRTLTFAVSAKRKILAIADDPYDAELWRLAHERKKEFECEVLTPEQVKDLAGLEAVALISVNDPTPLAAKLKAYVEGGGKLLIAPGLNVDKYAEFEPMPATLGVVKDWRDEPAPRNKGVSWKLDGDRDLAHPMLAPFREWRKRPDINLFKESGKAHAWKHYEVKEKPPETVVAATYDDGEDDPAKRRPAVLERTFGRGKVLLLTTRIDVQDAEDTGIERWNDYWRTVNTSWYVVFPNVLMRYLAGSPDDAVYNFPTGQDVPVVLPAREGRPPQLLLGGPGVSGKDATPLLGDQQSEYRLTRPLTLNPGEFRVRFKDQPWEERFSLFVPPEESVLEKVPEEAFDPLFGPGRVAVMGRDAKLTDVPATGFDEPVELFPWLLIAVLVLFACEGLFANRFYKGRA